MSLPAVTVGQTVSVRGFDGEFYAATVFSIPSGAAESDDRVIDETAMIAVQDANGRVFAVPRDQIS